MKRNGFVSIKKADMSVAENDSLIIRSDVLSKQDVEIAKYREQIRVIERRGRITAWNEYVSFVVAKTLGVTGLIVGGLGLLAPDLLPTSLAVKPSIVGGVGLALLTGKSILSLIARLEKSMRT